MDRTDIEWIKLNIKQCVLKISFYVMVACMALFIYLLSCMSANNHRDVNVLMMCEDGKTGRDLAEELIKEAPEGYDFSFVESEDEIIRLVTSGEADCGIIFPHDLDFRLSKGKDAVKFYQYSGGTAGYTVREVVFPHLLKRVSNDLIENYIDEQDRNTPQSIKSAIKKANDTFVQKTDINIFTIKEIESSSEKEAKSASIKSFIICLISIIIAMIMIAESEHENSNYYKSLKKSERIKRRIEAASVRVVLIFVVLCYLFIVFA